MGRLCGRCGARHGADSARWASGPAERPPALAPPRRIARMARPPVQVATRVDMLMW
ncbi:hypothetical protein SSIG_08011 [Streptomyces filamentosus NRRL 11379]|nr:hypothetical protein SSIG_08011 [Streptomyces filamentosus NRRL 11379]